MDIDVGHEARAFGATMLSLVASAVLALTSAQLTYRGYGEEEVSVVAFFGTPALAFIASLAVAAGIGRAWRINPGTTVGWTALFGLPIFIAAMIAMTVASCAGWGTHECLFS